MAFGVRPGRPKQSLLAIDDWMRATRLEMLGFMPPNGWPLSCGRA
jgi:hypothetical protein